MNKPHYHLTMHISEELFADLAEISKLFLKPEFKGLTLEINPGDLFPDRLRDSLSRFLIQTIKSVHLANKGPVN